LWRSSYGREYQGHKLWASYFLQSWQDMDFGLDNLVSEVQEDSHQTPVKPGFLSGYTRNFNVRFVAQIKSQPGVAGTKVP
jgi:hypothetical protein